MITLNFFINKTGLLMYKRYKKHFLIHAKGAAVFWTDTWPPEDYEELL